MYGILKRIKIFNVRNHKINKIKKDFAHYYLSNIQAKSVDFFCSVRGIPFIARTVKNKFFFSSFLS